MFKADLIAVAQEFVPPHPRRVARPLAWPQAQWRRLSALLLLLVVCADRVLAQVIQPGGQNRPDDVINGGICANNGLLSWLTGTKMIATFLAVGLVGFFIGRFFGKGGAQEGLIGTGVAVLGLAAIKAIVGIFVTGC